MNDTPTFPPGTIVTLKSGGPRLTVCGTRPDGTVMCQWFANEELHGDAFNNAVLQVVTDEPVRKECPDSPWKSLEKETPPDNRIVVWGKYDVCRTMNITHGNERPEGFTHWMLIPSLP